MNQHPRSVVLLSGGLDSTTALGWALHRGPVVAAVTVNYGQRHVREIDAAAAVAATYRVDHVVLDLSGLGASLPGSALTDPAVDVPDGHYADDNMTVTVVPNRNAVLLSAAAGVAAARGAHEVVTAVHAGDHTIYPDCRPEFITAISAATLLGCGVTVNAPFQHMTKTGIVNVARQLAVPLGLTWSCYRGGAYHCGTCGTCVERREAFDQAGVDDPTTYQETR